MKARLIAILSSLILVSGTVIGVFATPAFANVPHQICDAYPKCLNNWFAQNQYVKSYNFGVTNNYFETPGDFTHCFNPYTNQYSDLVYAGEGGEWCPFSHHDLDTAFDQHIIVVMKDMNSGLCVGNDPSSDGLAYEVSCSKGSGTLFINAGQGNCPNGYDLYVNRYWSDYYDISSGIVLTDTNGANIAINVNNHSSCLRAA